MIALDCLLLGWLVVVEWFVIDGLVAQLISALGVWLVGGFGPGGQVAGVAAVVDLRRQEGRNVALPRPSNYWPEKAHHHQEARNVASPRSAFIGRRRPIIYWPEEAHVRDMRTDLLLNVLKKEVFWPELGRQLAWWTWSADVRTH